MDAAAGGRLDPSCITGASAFADVATVNLGGGGDRLRGGSSCPPGTDPEFGFSFHLVADGGSGNDTISGTAGADDLKGGPGADTLEGNVGDDTLDGGVNVDADVLSGGPGFDTVSYSGHAFGVPVNLDGLANDGLNQPGQPAEQDNVSSDVERVLGSARNDILSGFAGSQTLVGNGGNDTVAGGGGRDSIFGGADNDNLNAQSDALADAVIDCGPGTDTAVLDLQDRLTPPSTDPTTGLRLPGSSCETVFQFAVDDGPPGRALKQRPRPRPDGKVVVRIACPRRARTACRGTLTLRPVNGRRVLARGRYRVRLGRNASVSLTARRDLPRQVVAEMKEQGVSKKGPRSSSRLLRVIG